MRPLTIPAALVYVLAACGDGGTPDEPAVSSDVDPSDVPPPSVLLISLDTLRADHMSLYGYDRSTTPFLEELAQDSLVFERAISASCWTLSSHMSMLTGLYTTQHGIILGRTSLTEEMPLIAQTLQKQGYQTLGIYKQGWIHPSFGFDRGFDVFRKHEEATEAAVNLWKELDELNPNLPYFLFLHLFDIHAEELNGPDDPYFDPPAPYDTLFVEDARARLAGLNFAEIRDTTAEGLSDAQLEALEALYDGNIVWIDSLLREWFAEFERRGLLKNTLVVLTSDHGEALGRRGTIRGHGGMWQDGLHVPLIVRFPDHHRAGEREATLASHVDIVPTILDVTGYPIDERLPGSSLRAALPADRLVRADKPPFSAFFQWPLKAVLNDKGVRMYDLAEDPGEQSTDASRGRTAAAQALERAFDAQFEARPFVRYNPVPGGRISPSQRAQLEALGYGGELDETDDQ